jgi:hypothetical protein
VRKPALPFLDRLSPQVRAIEFKQVEGDNDGVAFLPSAVAQMIEYGDPVFVAGDALYPTLSAVGNVQKTFGSTGSLAILETLSASVGAQLSVPIAQRAAGFGKCTRGTRHRATRPGGGVVYGAGGDRHAFTSASGDDRGGVTRVAGSAGAGRGRLCTSRRAR